MQGAAIEWGEVDALQTELGAAGFEYREGRQDPIPGDEDGRQDAGLPTRTVCPQRIRGITGAGDGGA
jgi:hypothetical protein